MLRILMVGVLVLGSPLGVLAAEPRMVGQTPGLTPALDDEQRLGRRLFFDPTLSRPAGLSCASCHQPQSGFADPDSHLPVSEGAIKGRFTSRNAPSVAYTAFSPAFHFDQAEGLYIGGQFHDGRAASLEAQVDGPLFSELEMNAGTAEEVLQKLRRADYAPLFERVYGSGALADSERALEYLRRALSAYERSAEISPFSSKYDFYLAGQVTLTAPERRGLKVFEDENKGNCAACHPSARDEQGKLPLFTDFSYDNLGLPVNSDNPFRELAARFNPNGQAFVDRGLGKTTGEAAEAGKFKVPTLRNIALTAPYMHHGIFSTLEEVVDFYNTRDVDEKWGAPEVAATVNEEELGDLKLTAQEVEDLVAFLKTLTDGYRMQTATR